jgi:hypothetical protein
MAVEVRWTLQTLEYIDLIAEFITKDSHFYAQVQTERFFERTVYHSKRILKSKTLGIKE